MINRSKRVQPIKLVFWTALFGVLTDTFATHANEGYRLFAAVTLVCFAVCSFMLIVSVNFWLDQRDKKIDERKKRSYDSIHGIDPRRFQARPK
jgi:hypothetical protein